MIRCCSKFFIHLVSIICWNLNVFYFAFEFWLHLTVFINLTFYELKLLFDLSWASIILDFQNAVSAVSNCYKIVAIRYHAFK